MMADRVALALVVFAHILSLIYGTWPICSLGTTTKRRLIIVMNSSIGEDVIKKKPRLRWASTKEKS
jgi:hypothetical protein